MWRLLLKQEQELATCCQSHDRCVNELRYEMPKYRDLRRPLSAFRTAKWPNVGARLDSSRTP